MANARTLTCVAADIVDGTERQRATTYGLEHYWDDLTPLPRCRDCGVTTGSYHHPGCVVAECPLDGNQLLLCEIEHEHEREAAQ